MIIIGIDPGTRITGYGIICCRNRRAIAHDFGCIRTPAQAAKAARYKIIFEAIEELLATHHPGAMAVEGQFVYKNPLSAMMVGMARAMALLAAERGKVPIFEYAPAKVKKAVTGKGSATKQQVQRMVQMHLNLEQPPPTDAADALALALCHSHLLPCAHV